ncbi:MAG TPA: hypothetical protein VFI15_05860 [Candidatus Limnocylindrales bacterium]|nr:hypothetical protein [Candidatus Limnocylindrales bacterium]
MNKRSKLLALLGATVLSVGVVGVAFANTLSVDKPNMVAPKTLSQIGVKTDCTDFTGDFAVGEGEVGIHFILTQPESNSGTISGSVDGVAFGPVAGIFHGESDNGAMHFYVIVPGDADSVINDAVTDVDGGELTVSHLCFGETEQSAPPSEVPSEAPSATPTFELETAGITDAPSEPSTDTFDTNGTSGPADGAWLLVVALGVLLASIVVLTPARAKGRR